ncbi:MAG: Lrp/AsnC family transcriptional regulator [Rubrivivax sp.]|nr:Lrp/AsnC family transcriptional regulator [Rubrivivax sp.]
MHLSQPAVTERVRKLEAAGVITGYRATVNLGALGYGIRALVRATGRCDHGRMLRLIDEWARSPVPGTSPARTAGCSEIAVVDVAHLDRVVRGCRSCPKPPPPSSSRPCANTA